MVLLNANLYCANFSACVCASRIEPYAAHAGDGQDGDRAEIVGRSRAPPGAATERSSTLGWRSEDAATGETKRWKIGRTRSHEDRHYKGPSRVSRGITGNHRESQGTLLSNR